MGYVMVKITGVMTVIEVKEEQTGILFTKLMDIKNTKSGKQGSGGGIETRERYKSDKLLLKKKERFQSGRICISPDFYTIAELGQDEAVVN